MIRLAILALAAFGLAADGPVPICLPCPNAAPAVTSSYADRCAAITQKGTQCKRNAKAGSKYCWQHQPKK